MYSIFYIYFLNFLFSVLIVNIISYKFSFPFLYTLIFFYLYFSNASCNSFTYFLLFFSTSIKSFISFFLTTILSFNSNNFLYFYFRIFIFFYTSYINLKNYNNKVFILPSSNYNIFVRSIIHFLLLSSIPFIVKIFI